VFLTYVFLHARRNLEHIGLISQRELLAVVELVYCLTSNDMSVTQVTGDGHVTVLIMEELKVTEASYIFVYTHTYICI
jgi:hypothetical protein